MRRDIIRQLFSNLAWIFLMQSVLACQTVWHKNGFSELEAQTWKIHGFRNEDVADAKIWRDAGFSADEAAGWRSRSQGNKFSLSEAKAWKDAGLNSQDARKWKEKGFKPTEVKAWLALDFIAKDPSAALDWKSNGFAPQDAGAWHSAGIELNEAKEWRSLGFSKQVFDLSKHGFSRHQEGLQFLGKNKIISFPVPKTEDESVVVVKGIRESLNLTLAQFKIWRSNNFTLHDVIKMQKWTEAGFIPSELRDWPETGLEPAVALAYKQKNIDPKVAKQWFAIGKLADQQALILEWTAAGLSAEDFVKWSDSGLTPDRISGFAKSGVTPDEAKRQIRFENNFFHLRYSAEGGEDDEGFLKNFQLDDGSIVSDEAFLYAIAESRNGREIFARTFEDIAEKMNRADTEYKKEVLENILRDDKRITDRMNEFKEYAESRWLCHSSDFEKKYKAGSWYLASHFRKKNPNETLPPLTAAEKNTVWMLQNSDIHPFKMTVANYGKIKCSPDHPMEFPEAVCMVDVQIPRERYEEFDDGHLKVFWCLKPPLRNVYESSAAGSPADSWGVLQGTEVRLVVTGKDGKIVTKD
jgi:hypothetical protein